MKRTGDQIKALYDNNPYPIRAEQVPQRGVPLLIHWINAAVAPQATALQPSSNILSAGCGTGQEVFLLAQQFPQAQITGVDFSEKSIEIAQQHAAAMQLKNVRFEVVDLMQENWPFDYQPFDFVSCHGVADFVQHPTKLLNNLSDCLSDEGVLYLTVNSPYHPATRIKHAFAELWDGLDSFEESPEHRSSLHMITHLMGHTVGIEGVEKAPKQYLDIDIFPPVAHHVNADTWINWGLQADLEFAGSLDALVGLATIPDEYLPLLYAFDRAALSKWIIPLQQQAGTQLLFRKKHVEYIPFEGTAIWDWHPTLSASIGTLPLLNVEPQTARPISLQFPSMPLLNIATSAVELEVLRCCNGQNSIDALLDKIGLDIDRASLKQKLFRAYQYGLIS